MAEKQSGNNEKRNAADRKAEKHASYRILEKVANPEDMEALADIATAAALAELDRNIQRYGTAKSDHARGMKFKELAGETVISEKMTEEKFLKDAGLREKDKVYFYKLGPTEKQAVYDYYAVGISKGLDSKKQRGLAIQLTIFFYFVKNNQDVLNGKIPANELDAGPVSLAGSNIDKLIGTSLAIRGEEISDLISKYIVEKNRQLDERGRQLDERGRQLDERGRQLDELLEALKQIR